MNPMNNNDMLSAVKAANSILLCTHVSPDGDAIGSTLAMYFVLSRLGKTVMMACEHAVPAQYAFLPCAERIQTPDKFAQRRFDAVLALDVAEPKRMGACLRLFDACRVRLQIDHHASNPCYAQINEVNGEATATGDMVIRLAQALRVPISKDMAMCLYAAISSDNGNFCFDNTNAECFEHMTLLMQAGLPLSDMARKLHLVRSSPHVLLLGRALNTMEYFEDGKITGMHLCENDYQVCGASREHADKIVNYGLDQHGVVMTFFADDTARGVKFSLRALPPYNVASVAARFGGGGHTLAAGCTLEMPLVEAMNEVRKALAEQLQA